MISKKDKFIFIHNFKTGGTSIESKLGHFDTLERDVQDHRSLREIELLTNRMHFFKTALYAIKIGKAKSAKNNFKKALSPELTKQEFNAYYKFTFVRNTWSRMHSWYANTMKDELMKKSYQITDPNYSFQQFLTEKIDHEKFSQLYFLKDKTGNVAMDFIGRFENLQDDFNKVCAHLKIKDPTLPKLLVRKRRHYTDFYTPETKDLIYQLYKEEIDYFGFNYGE